MDKQHGSLIGGFILVLAMTAIAGCSKERPSTQASTASRAASVKSVVLETYGEDERDAIRIRTDTARARLWVLGLEQVRVYDTVTKNLIREVALPNWTVRRFVCEPNLALDRSGSAFISGNVTPTIWQIDADSFQVKEHEIRLQGKEHWDTGFGALAFAKDGTLYALTSVLGSLWKVDVARASASMIQLNDPPEIECAFTAQFLKDFEKSEKPWTRPSPDQS